MNTLLQTYAWSHFCMCCEGIRVIWQDYQQVCLPPLFSLCQLPAVVESPWEPLQHMTWISMSFSCRWPLCPTLPLQCTVYTYTTAHAKMPTCALRYFKWLFFFLTLLRLNPWEYKTDSHAVFTCVFNNSTRRIQCGKESAFYCKLFCNLSTALSSVIRRATVHLKVSKINPGAFHCYYFTRAKYWRVKMHLLMSVFSHQKSVFFGIPWKLYIFKYF